MADQPTGFEYQLRGADVVVTHHGRPAATLRGAAAAQFLTQVERGNPQQVMARVTGQYRHGNERAGKDHPRNRAR